MSNIKYDYDKLNKECRDTMFILAVDPVLVREGGYVDDPNDRGGATNFGISLRFLSKQRWINQDINNDGEVNYKDIGSLESEDAMYLYFKEWWEKYHYADFPLQIAKKLLDTSVNMGASACHKIMQRALIATVKNTDIDVDGILGPKTRALIKSCDPVPLLAAFRADQAGYYRELVAHNSDMGKFLNGWLARAKS